MFSKILFVMISQISYSFSHLSSCTFIHDTEFYDLTRLPAQSWNVSAENNNFLRRVSISLCNHAYTSPCGNVSFCAIAKNNSLWSEHIPLNTSLVQRREGIIISTIINNKNTTTMQKINVEVKLICVSQSETPSFKLVDGNLSVIWNTKSACGIPAYRECLLNDEEKGEINLQRLLRMDYYYHTVDDERNEYFINLCGGTVGKSVCGDNEDVSACVIDSRNKIEILALASKQRVKSNNLVLEYRKTKRKLAVNIKLICKSDKIAEMQFIQKDASNTYFFELETEFACVEKLKKCYQEDADHFRYDLSVLSRKDHEIYHGNYTYIVSVCQSVKDPRCPRGVSVCGGERESNLFANFGSLTEGPDVGNELKISSSGGAKCNVKKLRYRSVILFKCSKTDNSPKLLSRNESDCLLTIEWRTKAACPYVFSDSNGCVVNDPVTGYIFNLTALRNSRRDYFINGSNGNTFQLNICGALLKPCNRNENVGVCRIDSKGIQHEIGDIALRPQYYNRHLSFTLNGGKCETSTSNSSVTINFVCIHSAKREESFPRFLKENGNCSYEFEWHSVVACAPYRTYPCQASDNNGEVYDLSPLSSSNRNYVVLDNKTNAERKFFINICEPLIFASESMCYSESGACMQDLGEPNPKKSFTNLGMASELKFDNERMVFILEYSSGTICLHGDIEMKTVITFNCDRRNMISNHFSLIKENGCVYEFEFKTNLVCPKKQSIEEGSICSASNFDNSIRVNLNQFANREYSLSDDAGDVYRLAICGTVHNISHSGVGICHETAKGCENLGLGNSNFQFDRGSVYLNYTDGINCSKATKTHTMIKFVCDEGNSRSGVIRKINLCTYLVEWYSESACVVSCKTDGPKQINLSFLSKFGDNYKISTNGVDYFINICKPLVPVDGLSCPHESAICKAIPQSPNGWSNAVTLGFSHLKPIEMDNKVLLNYSSRFPCIHNISLHQTSSVFFICDVLVGVGSPVLNKAFDCHHEFFWKTSVVCEDYMIEVPNDSITTILRNDQSNTIIDLQPLCNSTYQVKEYTIRMCSSISLCEIQGVRNQKTIFFGKANSVVFNYSRNITKLFLSGSDECDANAEYYHATISFFCASNGEELLRILKETNCSVEFEWKTSAGCAHYDSSNERSVGEIPTKSSLNIVGIVLGVLLVIVILLLGYVLKKATLITHFCRRNVNRWLRSRHSGEFHYDLRNPDSFDLDASSEELL